MVNEVFDLLCIALTYHALGWLNVLIRKHVDWNVLTESQDFVGTELTGIPGLADLRRLKKRGTDQTSYEKRANLQTRYTCCSGTTRLRFRAVSATRHVLFIIAFAYLHVFKE